MTVSAPIAGARPFGLKFAAHRRFVVCLRVKGHALHPWMVTVNARIAHETLVLQPEVAIFDLLVEIGIALGRLELLGGLRCLGLNHVVPVGELLPQLRWHLHTGPAAPLGHVVVLSHGLLVLHEALWWKRTLVHIVLERLCRHGGVHGTRHAILRHVRLCVLHGLVMLFERQRVEAMEITCRDEKQLSHDIHVTRHDA